MATPTAGATGVMVRGGVPRAQRAGFWGSRERSERGIFCAAGAIFVRILRLYMWILTGFVHGVLKTLLHCRALFARNSPGDWRAMTHKRRETSNEHVMQQSNEHQQQHDGILKRQWREMVEVSAHR